MNNESIAKLRVDRRLHRRRGWIATKELQDELDALPDVSDKILDSRDDAPGSESGETPADGIAPVPGSPVGPEGGGV